MFREKEVRERLIEADLEFDSKFESGNLDVAIKQSENEYDLLMRTDTNTKGHKQWFYFSVKNKKTGVYKFNILNFTKQSSLYNHGMKIALYSQKKTALAISGKLPKIYLQWHHGGDKISYTSSKLCPEPNIRSRYIYNRKKYYTLSFEYNFEYIDDVVYFAYSIPYTFTDLATLLKELNPDIIKQKILCKTLSGIDIPLLTINEKTIDKKPIIILTARIHPGEICSSFVIQGFLRFIVSSNKIAKALRNSIHFKIIPMLNPDGVIAGNYRVGYSGQDLNRHFAKPDSLLHPEICAIKKIIRGKDVLGYLDLHGHSKKKCVFIYGPYYPLHSNNYLAVRVFAKLLEEATEMFRYKACKFKEEQDKMSAARLVLSKEFGIMNSFTIEASFYAFINKERQLIEFDSELYELMGQKIGETIFEYQSIIEEDRLRRLQKLYLYRLKKKKNRGRSLSKDKILSKPSRLSILYESIKKDNTNYTDNTSDSDSNESQDDLTSEQQKKTLKKIIKTLRRYNNEHPLIRKIANKFKKKLKMSSKNFLTIEASKGISMLLQRKTKGVMKKVNKTVSKKSVIEVKNLNHSTSTLVKPNDALVSLKTYKKKDRIAIPLSDCYLPELIPVEKKKSRILHKIHNNFFRILKDHESLVAKESPIINKSMNDIQLAVKGSNVNRKEYIINDFPIEESIFKRNSYTSSRNYKAKYSVKLKNGIIIKETPNQYKEDLFRTKVANSKYRHSTMLAKDCSNCHLGIMRNSKLSKSVLTQVYDLS